MAATKGDKFSQYSLGRIYHNNEKFEKLGIHSQIVRINSQSDYSYENNLNLDEAIKYFKIAAKHGNVFSKLFLYKIYENNE